MSECTLSTQVRKISISIQKSDWLYRFKMRRDLQVACVLIVIILIIGFFAPDIAPQNPNITDLEGKNQGPTADHILGTDYLGRDLFSRVICGLQTSLEIALATIVISFIIGVTIGSFSGYQSGWIDNVIGRIIDVFLAFPSVILALALMMLLGSGVLNMIIMLSIVQWASFARLTRGQVLAEKNQEYVLSAKAAALPGWWTMTKHILPNCIMPVIVLATIDIGHAILTIATLSFLGVGIPPAIPEWGSMINSGLPYMRIAPLNVIVPGLAITCVTLLFNITGEGIRDITDPKTDNEGSL
ncbi:ABC transporter permease [Methanospirillum hungatei]|uniref:ABC transporter permease n=1 Tax=Methanospirillum hungatei TaxID=2203 RepID=UPI0026F0C596|nr:ABC transporter permease [Methanospirillum hungatei]MCA1916295.1 ABC transporter permease [Methanospirillum hungatei]